MTCNFVHLQLLRQTASGLPLHYSVFILKQDRKRGGVGVFSTACTASPASPAGFVGCQSEEERERGESKHRAVHVDIVIGMSGMTNQFGSGLVSSSLLPPSFPLILCLLTPSAVL